MFAMVGIAIFMIFENRFTVLFVENHWWSYARKPYLALNVLLALTYATSTILMIPEQEPARKDIAETSPSSRRPEIGGLWCLDLAITHIMQVTIPEKERNTVFGVHIALCQSFSVLKDVLVIILPLAATFAICIFISFAFMAIGHFFFVYYLIKPNSLATPSRQLSEIQVEEENDEFARL